MHRKYKRRKRKIPNETPIYIQYSLPKEEIKTIVNETIHEYQKSERETEILQSKKEIKTNDAPLKKETLWAKIKLLFSFPFYPSKKITGTRATDALIKLFVSLFFFVIYFVLLLGAFCLIFAPLLEFLVNKQWIGIEKTFEYLGFGVVAYLFSGFFRMAGKEMEKANDKDYLVAVFAVIVAIITIIIDTKK